MGVSIGIRLFFAAVVAYAQNELEDRDQGKGILKTGLWLNG